MQNKSLLAVWHTFLKIAFIYAVYHLIRDVLQDLLGIHFGFTEIAHFEPDPLKTPTFFHPLFFGGYRQYLTFPIEIFTIITVPKALKNKRFTILDLILLLLFLFTAALYFIIIIYAK